MEHETPTIEEALELVNQMPFPAAVVGDFVEQFGYKFVLTVDGWVQSPEGA